MRRPLAALFLLLASGSAWADPPKAVVAAKASVPAGSAVFLDGSKSVSEPGLDLRWSVTPATPLVVLSTKDDSRPGVYAMLPAPADGRYKVKLTVRGRPDAGKPDLDADADVFFVTVGAGRPVPPTPAPKPAGAWVIVIADDSHPLLKGTTFTALKAKGRAKAYPPADTAVAARGYDEGLKKYKLAAPAAVVVDANGDGVGGFALPGTDAEFAAKLKPLLAD